MNNFKKKIMMISILAGLSSTVLDGCSKDNNAIYVNETIEDDETSKSKTKNKDVVTDISYKQVLKALEKNKNINENYKEKIKEVILKLETFFPNINLKYLYKNIKTLKIKKIEKTDDSIVGNYDSENNIISVVKNKSSHYLHHEILHLLNNYKDQKHFYSDVGFSFNEGFVEWLNINLFPSKKYSYKMQVADINIIKNILNLDDEKLVNLFINNDIKYLSKKLGKYSNKEDINELINICDLELDNYEYSDECISSSQIDKKYELLLQMLVISKKGTLNNYKLYKMYEKLYNSFIIYQERIYADDLNLDSNITSYLKDKCMKVLMTYAEDKNNDITIYQDEFSNLRYCDINNLYLGNLEENGIIYQTIFEQVKHNNQLSYFDLLNTENKDITGYQFIPLNDLNIYDGITVYEIFEQGYNKVKTYS